jgi:hypothetical protein
MLALTLALAGCGGHAHGNGGADHDAAAADSAVPVVSENSIERNGCVSERFAELAVKRSEANGSSRRYASAP